VVTYNGPVRIRTGASDL